MFIRSSIFIILFHLGFAHAQQNIRLMHYNLLNFGNTCGSVNVLDKYGWLGTILEEAQPDVFTVNELNPNPIYSNGIISQSFKYTNAFDKASITNTTNSSIVNQLFYNKDKVALVSEAVVPYSLRDINAYKLYVKGSGGNGSDSLFFFCIVGHFKASRGDANESSRNVAATAVMNWIDANANGEAVVVMGDMNIYGPNEAAYRTLTNNTNASLSLNDFINTTAWGNANGAGFYTQSTSSSRQDCGSGGGLDDRFDIMLMSDKLVDANEELHVIPQSYKTFGNDGNTFNQTLGCTGNNEVPFGVCSALVLMSDHLPIVADLEASSVVSRNKELGIPGLKIVLSPQPASSSFTLQLDATGGRLDAYDYTLSNMLGQAVIADKTNRRNTLIPVSNLDRGLYILKIEDETGRFSTKRVWLQ